MARASVQTLLAVDRWASILGIDPWTFNQVGLGFPDNSVVGLNASCGSVFYQTSWQGSARNQQLSIEEIALAIQRAEDMLAEQLTFYPAPKYIAQEMDVYPMVQGKPYAANGGVLWQSGFGFPYAYPKVPSVQLAWHKVWGGGVLARTDYGDTVNLTLIDSTTGIPAVAPAFNDMFTCTIVVPSGTSANEICAYYRPADRVPINSTINETWRLRPVTVTVSGTTATITGHATLLVKPNLKSGVTVEPLDVTTATNYVGQVNVQRVYRDDTQQGNAYWEKIFPCDETPCDLTYVPVCLGDRNSRMGQVAIHFADNTNCCTEWRAPDSVTVNYLAGEALVNNEMSEIYAQMVTFLAASLLASFTCSCERARFLLEYWQHNVTQGGTIAGRTVEPRQLNQHEALSPFGFTNGGLYAWNRMTSKAQVTGVSVH